MTLILSISWTNVIVAWYLKKIRTLETNWYPIDIHNSRSNRRCILFQHVWQNIRKLVGHHFGKKHSSAWYTYTSKIADTHSIFPCKFGTPLVIHEKSPLIFSILSSDVWKYVYIFANWFMDFKHVGVASLSQGNMSWAGERGLFFIAIRQLPRPYHPIFWDRKFHKNIDISRYKGPVHNVHCSTFRYDDYKHCTLSFGVVA